MIGSLVMAVLLHTEIIQQRNFHGLKAGNRAALPPPEGWNYPHLSPSPSPSVL